MQYWPMVVFGWPSAILGGTLLIVGVIRRSVKLAVIGAIVSAGFCVYISLNPAPFRWLGLLAISGNFLGPVMVRRNAHALAGISITPFVLVTLFLAYAVINE